MSAGELGHSAGELEGSLNKVLEVSTKWGAVLLLDECEVFLEKRTAVDIERNKLVSGELMVLNIPEPKLMYLCSLFALVGVLQRGHVSDNEPAFHH
jgi:hypothetical protein